MLYFLIYLFYFVYTKDLCYLRLDNINIDEFFSEILLKHSLNKTIPYHINGINRDNNNKHNNSINNNNTRFDNKFDDCDIFDNETSIQIIFGKNKTKILKFLKLFNVKGMSYFIEFLQLLENKEILKVKELWKFYFGTYFNQNKYKYNNEIIPSFDLSLPNNNTSNNKNNVHNDWKDTLIDISSNILGRNRVYNLSNINESIIETEKNLSSSNIIIILSKHAFNLRMNLNNNNNNYREGENYNNTNNIDNKITNEVSSFLISTSNFFKSGSKSFSEFLGVYEKDEQGRKPFRYLNDFIFPVINKINTNKTYNKFVSDTISNFIPKFKFKEKFWNIKLNNLINYVYNKVKEDFRWTNIKNSIYDNFFGKQTKSTLKMIYNIFTNPFIRSLEIKDFVSNNYKVKKAKNYFTLMSYIYGQNNLHKSNIIRFSNIIYYIPSYINNINNNNINNITKKKKKSSRFLDVSYYDGIKYNFNNDNNDNKYYNLPEYDSDDEWILSIFDLFDLRFWLTSYNGEIYTWFTGFHPDDRRKLRPLGLSLFLVIPVLVPSDFFSLIDWGLNYLLRSNNTLTFLPFLEEYYEAPNYMMCLPAPIYVPEPEFGCEPPTFEFAPPIFPPENYTDLFVIEFYLGIIPYMPFCEPYRNPFKIVLFIIQGILTASLGPLIPNNPIIRVIFDFISDILSKIFGFEFDFILGSDGEGSEALPVGMWQCIFGQIWLLIIIAAVLIVISIVICSSCFKNIRLSFLSAGNISNDNKIKDLSHEVEQAYEMQRVTSIATVHNNIEINKYKKEI